jgi:hypothetical protein
LVAMSIVVIVVVVVVVGIILVVVFDVMVVFQIAVTRGETKSTKKNPSCLSPPPTNLVI